MEWQEAIRDRFNIKGEQVVVAKPSNPAHLSILKEMCLGAGFTSDQANSIVLILEKFQAKSKETGKVVDFSSAEARDDAIKKGTHDELESDDEEGKEGGEGETNPNFAEPGKKPKPGQSTVDGSHHTSEEPEESEEEKKAKSKEKVEAVTKRLYGEDGNGPLLQESETTQQALDNGYKKGKPWVAPGNAGSNFNENMSNEGALILEEEEDLTEDELTDILFNRTRNTALGKQQKKTTVESPHNKDKGDVPSDLSAQEKELYRACRIAARAAKEKRDRAKRGQEAAGMEGAKIKSFGGTESDLDALKEEVRKAAEAGKKILIYDEETGQVVEIPAEVMLDWIDSSGGGENAADTAVISIDKDGNILYDGWSDKKAFSDIQGNSTLNDDYTKQIRNVDKMLEDGRIDENTAKRAKDIIENSQRQSAEIEENYKKAPLKTAQHFSNYRDDERARLLQHLQDQAKKYDDAGSANHITDTKPPAKEPGLMQRYGVDNYDDLLAAMIDECENGKPSGKVLKVMDRLGDSERAHLMDRDGKIPAGLDTKVILSNAREQALNLQRQTVDQLNDLQARSRNGKEKRLGDILGFQETVDFLHLDKIEEPKDENDHEAFLKRNTHLCMAGVSVPPATLKKCLEVDNISEAEDNFEVVTDERIMKDRDTGKYTTGKVVYIYAINKNNERVFIGEKVFRSKEGPTGKTGNDIKWSKEMQECFDRNRAK